MQEITKISDKDLYAMCRRYGAEARAWTKKFAALLPEVSGRELYKKYGFYSIFEFAAKLAGMNRDLVLEVLRISRNLEDKPLLLAKLETHGVNKLRLVATVATKENESMLAEKVETMSKAALATFVHEKFRAGTEFDQNNTLASNKQATFIPSTIEPKAKTPKHITITIPFEPDVELKLREFQKKLSREKGFPVDLNETIKILLNRNESSKNKNTQAKKAPIKKLTVSRYIPANVKKFLYEKYDGRCAFPGCMKLPEIYHHTRRYALHPDHDPDFLMPLCKGHERLAHHGLIENEEQPPEQWRVKTAVDKTTAKYAIDRFVNKLRMTHLSYQPDRHS